MLSLLVSLIRFELFHPLHSFKPAQVPAFWVLFAVYLGTHAAHRGPRSHYLPICVCFVQETKTVLDKLADIWG